MTKNLKCYAKIFKKIIFLRFVQIKLLVLSKMTISFAFECKSG